jgi:hypothetical protein
MGCWHDRGSNALRYASAQAVSDPAAGDRGGTTVTAQHPSRDDVPEEDRLEQQAPLDPSPSPDQEALIDVADAAPGLLTDEADEADEADRLEQREVLPGSDEEDYPHEA